MRVGLTGSAGLPKLFGFTYNALSEPALPTWQAAPRLKGP